MKGKAYKTDFNYSIMVLIINCGFNHYDSFNHITVIAEIEGGREE